MNSTNVLRLMSDDTRLRVLMLLKIKPLCVSQMQLILDVPQSMLSKHLAKLRESDLVIAQPDGKFMKYELVRDPLVLSILNSVLNKSEDNEFINDAKKINDYDYLLDACQECSLYTQRTKYIV